MTLTLALLTGGRDHILPMLEDDKAWQRTRFKSASGAADILVSHAKRVALDEATALILPDIQSFYAEYVKNNGERPDISPTQHAGDWDDGLDDGLLEIFEPFANVLAGSWLGLATTDARLWLPGEDERLARSFANDVWKQLTWQRTVNQILAGVGIVTADLEVYGTLAADDKVLVPTEPEYDPMSINAVLNKIMLSFPDTATLADELDMASDADENMGAAALERLGLDANDGKVLRTARTHGRAVIEAWCNAIEGGELLDPEKNYADLSGVADFDAGPELPPELVRQPGPPPVAAGSVPPPPPVSSSPATSAGTGGPPPAPASGKKKNGEPPDGYITKEILMSIKEHTGLQDVALAELMGVSRPTLGNIMKGKSHYVPHGDRREALKAMVALHTQKLTEAYAGLG